MNIRFSVIIDEFLAPFYSPRSYSAHTEKERTYYSAKSFIIKFFSSVEDFFGEEELDEIRENRKAKKNHLHHIFSIIF